MRSKIRNSKNSRKSLGYLNEKITPQEIKKNYKQKKK